MKPHVLTVGFALAISVSGFIFSQFRSHQTPPSGEAEEGRRTEDSSGELKKEEEEEESSPEFGTNAGEDDESYLLPEFNRILLQFSAEESQETEEAEKKKRVKSSEMEDEILTLRTWVDSLQERERNLEFKLLEYYGLEEQNAAVRELENRAHVSAVEAKLFSVRIDSLQVENQRLVAQVSDQAVELDSCKEKIEELETKLASDSAAAEKEEVRLREENMELSSKLEQLKTDRCEDVKELVYLKWVNARLRYELRNYRPRPPPEGGEKMVARELSKSMSPKSEEKAEQLIFEYANLDDSEKALMEFESENRRSSSPSSTPEPELREALYGTSSGTAKNGKVKFLGKLKKLVLGKDGRRSNKNRLLPPQSLSSPSLSDNAPASNSDSGRMMSDSTTCSVDDLIGRYSNGDEMIIEDDRSKMMWNGISSHVQRLNQLSPGGGRCRSDLGVSADYKRFEFGGDHVVSPGKLELKKLAGVLKNNHTSSESYI